MVTGKINIDLCGKINRNQKDRSLEIETENRSIQEVDVELAIYPSAVEERVQASWKLNSCVAMNVAYLAEVLAPSQVGVSKAVAVRA